MLRENAYPVLGSAIISKTNLLKTNISTIIRRE
jgi:hypothetical protein